jgi:anti-sigma factor RsiW
VTEYPAGYTCEVTVVLLERYVAGTLPRADALAVAEHLEACPPCLERLVFIRFGVTEGRALRA